MKLPTAEEINPFNDLDGQMAQTHFLGKSIQDATQLFEENSLAYQEDMQWMGPKAFDYYLPAIFNYLNSSASIGDSAFIGFLCNCIFEFRLEQNAEELKPSYEKIAKIVNYILENHERFEEIDEDTLDFQTRLQPKFQTMLKQVTEIQ